MAVAHGAGRWGKGEGRGGGGGGACYISRFMKTRRNISFSKHTLYRT